MSDITRPNRGDDSLYSFLEGTLCSSSPLCRLRGQSDILRQIWLLACEEWWDLHIERYGDEIPRLPMWKGTSSADYLKQYPEFRQQCGGCPVAIVEEGVIFPPLSLEPIEEIGSEYLYTNMMPISLKNLNRTVPSCCVGYIPMIELCLSRMYTGWGQSVPSDMIGYLTIDERPCVPGNSQRRGGLHVESPGVLPTIDSIDDLQYSLGGNFVPGAEHNWGNGLMMRDETFQGGIYMASNIADTCAVWNCRVNDRDGDIIGCHGNIERLRPILGPPTAKLRANDLVWMTDKTPHESLPLPENMAGVRRQYFRLVVGEVTAWFADHSTPNPLGVRPPPTVRIVSGNKFDIPATVLCCSWRSGSEEELTAARDELELRSALHLYGMGHRADILIQKTGIRSIRDLAKFEKREDYCVWGEDYGAHYYDMPRMRFILEVFKNKE